MDPDMGKIIEWLLSADEPWTRYRTRLDLLGEDPKSPEIARERKNMLADPLYQGLVSAAQSWPGYALKRHNDAKHPLQALTVLADFGARESDPGMEQLIAKILSHQSKEGAFEIKIRLYKRFGGMEGEYWTWMGCDAPVLFYVLSAFGLESAEPLQAAKELILSLGMDKGWSCSASPMLGKFKGPGKRDDPCPVATLQALKALSLYPDLSEDPRVWRGIDMLLDHWEKGGDRKYFLFGVGTDYKKLKYPLIWYDLLHVSEVLSRFPLAIKDPRFMNMAECIRDQADEKGFFTASSMYMAWKGWSFANKKEPSPWLTFLANRIMKRARE
jgi:hypothetical protein